MKIEEKRTFNFKKYTKSTNYAPSAVTHTQASNYDNNISYSKPSIFQSISRLQWASTIFDKIVP